MERTSYIDIPAIAAGTVLALAITIVLTHFGGSVGLAYMHDVEWERDSAFGKLIAIGLWFLWVQILAAITGGYVAGRMRQTVPGTPPHEREMRDGLHGLLVWATGTVAVAAGVFLAATLAAAVSDMPDNSVSAADLEALQRNAGVVIAFSVASSSLVSGVASWWAATLGGEHRDENVDHSRYVSFRRPNAG